MTRRTIQPRENWQKAVESVGLSFHTPEGRSYWDESACYEFRSSEVDELEAATAELQDLCLKAGQFIIDNDRFADFGIPEAARPAIRRAWEQEPPSIYGRFDLAYDGRGPAKLLEYNANTPTGLVEAAVVQWYWLQDTKPRADQFNSIHEKLIAQWREINSCLNNQGLFFTAMDNAEDLATITYLRDTAEQGGIRTAAIGVREIGWNAAAREFRDGVENRIGNIFSLYPWEWLLKDFAGPLLETLPDMIWIEPIWKMMWSNKALLAVLWEMFPGHPNLLETRLGAPGALASYARKPLLSREGANVRLFGPGLDVSTDGPYSDSGYVFQALAGTRRFDGKYPVLGSWLVTDQGPAGIGIRESMVPSRTI